MSLFSRIQERAADRFTSVQYPHVRPADRRTAEAGDMPVFKYPMPLPTRIFIGLVSLIAIGGCLLVLGVMLVMIYSVLFG